MKTIPALRISLGPSRSASALICVAYLATAMLVAWLPRAAALRGALVIAIGAYAIKTMRHAATRSASRAIIGIELDAHRAVRLTERTGLCIEGVVQPDSYVGALLTKPWSCALRANVACALLRSCPTCCPPTTSGGCGCCCVWGTVRLRQRIPSLRVFQPAPAVDDGAADEETAGAAMAKSETP
jgi:hypothetical protein